MIKNLLKSTVIGFLNKAVMVIGSFLILPLMLKQLGQNTFGVWMVISSSAGLMGFLDLGLGNTLMNYVAFNADLRPNFLKFVKAAYTIQFCFIGILLIAFKISFYHVRWGGILNLADPGDSVLRSVAITISCFLINLVTSTIYSIQRGLQKSYTANVWLLAGTIIYLFILWLVLKTNPVLEWIALVSFGTPIIVSLINSVIFFYREKLFIQTIFAENMSWRQIVSFTGDSGFLFFLQLAALICFETDCLILAHYTTYANVTQFSIAGKIFAVPAILLSVYLQSLWPAYAKAYSNGGWQWIKQIFRHSLIVTLLGAVFFIAALYVLKGLLLKYWLSGQIQIPAALFLAFSLWTILNSIDSNIAALLNGLNKLKIQVFLALLMVVSNLTFSILLVKFYGVPGVIWGTIISTSLCSTIPCAVYIKKIFSQDTRELMQGKP
jgi:O-antigen/teichoic acid export membrane protein